MRKLHNVKEMIFSNRMDAANTLASLMELADRYASVSVADYYDVIGESSCYTDNNYGWSIDSINKARIEIYHSKYLQVYKINFPPVEEIDAKIKVENVVNTSKKSITISVEDGKIDVDTDMHLYEVIGLLSVTLQQYQSRAVNGGRK